jgi:hypothetical protein
MNGQLELLVKIKVLVKARKYRVRLHAVRHMIEEGFSEENIIEALTGKRKIIQTSYDA